MFYNANAPLADGLRRNELLTMSDEEFEFKHGFIRWFYRFFEQNNPSAKPLIFLSVNINRVAYLLYDTILLRYRWAA